MTWQRRNPADEGGVRRRLAEPRDTPDNIKHRLDEHIVPAIRVELSERDPKRGDCTPVAACSLATVAGASPICALARKLLALEVDPATHLSIWRRGVKCFNDVPVGRWAELTVDEGGTGTVFRRYKPFPDGAVVPRSAKSDG